MGSGSQLFGHNGPFTAAIPKETPARLELGRAGVMALLGLVVPWLFDSPGRSDLVRQALLAFNVCPDKTC